MWMPVCTDVHVCTCVQVIRSYVWSHMPACCIYACLFCVSEHKKSSQREKQEEQGETQRERIETETSRETE